MGRSMGANREYSPGTANLALENKVDQPLRINIL